MKSEVDKLDIGKLETASVDLENKVIKKTEYNELVKRINNISTTDNSDLVKKTAENFKIKQNMYRLKKN